MRLIIAALLVAVSYAQTATYSIAGSWSETDARAIESDLITAMATSLSIDSSKITMEYDGGVITWLIDESFGWDATTINSSSWQQSFRQHLLTYSSINSLVGSAGTSVTTSTSTPTPVYTKVIEGNPWTCGHERQQKFHIGDFHFDLDGCLQHLNFYEMNVAPNQQEKICDKGLCLFKECCWDKVKTIGGMRCADPNPNAEITDVHIWHEGCVFKCEKTAYGPFKYGKEWENEVELTVAKHEVEENKSNFEVKFSARMEWKDVGSKKDADGNITTQGVNLSCDSQSIRTVVKHLDDKPRSSSPTFHFALLTPFIVLAFL